MIADNIHVKEIWVGDGATRRRFILVKNPLEDERDCRTRTRHLTRIQAALTAIARKTGDTKLAAEGALLAQPTLKRYLVRRVGNLVVSAATVRAEEKLDGKFLLSCTDDNLTAARLFKGLLDVERGFSDVKSVLEVRPVYHRNEDRIRAHVTICFLAIVLIRVAENATGQTWPAIARDLDRIHLIDLEGNAGRIRQRTEITDTQAHIRTACQASVPSLILAAEPIRRRQRKTA